MGTKKFDFFLKFEIEFDLYFDLCWRAEINIQVGLKLNMHLYVDIGDALSSLWGSTSSPEYQKIVQFQQIFTSGGLFFWLISVLNKFFLLHVKKVSLI